MKLAIPKKTIDRKSLIVKDYMVALFIALLVVVFLISGLSYAISPVDSEKPINTLTLRTSDFDMNFFEGVNIDHRDSDIVRDQIKSGDSFYSPEFIREILLYHFDVSFFLSLLLSSDASATLFMVCFILRFGLLGATSFLFLRKIIKTSKLHSLILAIAYSLSSYTFVVAGCTALINMLIIFPIALLLMFYYCKAGGRKLFILSTLSICALCFTGIYGVVIGIPMIVVIFFMLLFATNSNSKDVILRFAFTFLIGLFLSAIEIVAAIFKGISSKGSGNLNSAFSMKFTIFDSIYKFFDCNPVSGSISSNFPSIAISMFVVVLVILFFVNRVIPFAFKVASGLFLLLLYFFVASENFDILFLSFGKNYLFSYAIIGIICFYLLVLSGVSLCNVKSLTQGNIYFTCFAIIAFIVLSNNSKSDIAHGTVSLYLSFFGVIIVACLLLSLLEQKAGATFMLSFVVIAEIVCSSSFSLAPSKFPISDVFPQSYFDTIENEKNDFIFNGERDSFYIAGVDLTTLDQNMTELDRVNFASNTMVLEDLFDSCEAYPVYSNGIIDNTNGNYASTPNTTEHMLNIRVIKTEADGKCYLSSSNPSMCKVRIVYDDYEETQYFDGPFIYMFDDSSTSFVAAIEYYGVFDGAFKVSAGVLNENTLSEIRNRIYNVERGELNLSNDPTMKYEGIKTVVTSIRYSPNYNVIYTKNGETIDADTFNYGGHLAFKVESGGLEHQQAKVINDKKDLIIGTLVSVVSIITMIIVVIMYNKKDFIISSLLKGSNKEVVNLDKRED